MIRFRARIRISTKVKFRARVWLELVYCKG
jgi:hypothetical protein